MRCVPFIKSRLRVAGGFSALPFIACLSLTLSLCAACGAEGGPSVGDWPRWAGPHGDCTSDEKGLLRAWPEAGPKVLWRIPVGAGANHPSVAGDDLCYAQLEDDQLRETVRCVDANSGKSDHSGSATSRPAGSVFVIGELNESTDQQLLNSIHRPFTAGFANILPGIRFDSGGFVTALGAVAAVVLRHFCVRFL